VLTEQLARQRYGDDAVDRGLQLHGAEFLDMLAWWDELDANFARTWLEYTYGGLLRRRALDERTRLLTAIAQCATLGEVEEATSQIQAALSNGVHPREIFEAILQTCVYIGYPKMLRTARAFRAILADAGRLAELTDTQLPVETPHGDRSLEHERAEWANPESAFADLPQLFRKYGWYGISTGLRTQAHHPPAVERLDKRDEGYLKLWLDFIYAGMYTRGVLDDKTRILCMVADAVAVGEAEQSANHMRDAMRFGASPREVLEVLCQSTIYRGMLGAIGAMRQLDGILQAQGRSWDDPDLARPGLLDSTRS
jgi:alkylhydroperoxidase/carboxymuconolactone decarboxylase family protein YurZ